MAEPSLSPDFHDLLQAFADAEVRYLLVGGYAVGFHAIPRFTKDLDLWVDSSSDNLARIETALGEFGAPPSMAEQLARAGDLDVVWMGRPPNRVDLMKEVPGGDFEAAWPQRVATTWDGTPLQVVGRATLRKLKVASGRPKDLLDVEALDSSS